MSRSYKHTPYCGDKKTKEAKRRANKKYRNLLDRYGFDDTIAPSTHRKATETWNICDFHSIFTLKEWLKLGKTQRMFSNTVRAMAEEEKIRNWQKWYKWK